MNIIFRFAFLAGWILSTAAIRAENVPFEPWRSPANGGINVLYCYLRANGIPCEYSDLVNEQRAEEHNTGPCTVSTLARIAAKHKLRLAPVSLTMKELFACSFPVIVHMDGETPESGAFLLILNMSASAATRNDDIYYLNGPSAIIYNMNRDNFRRIWSGVALLPASSRNQDKVFVMIGFGAGFAICLLISFVRPKKSL